MKPNQKAPTVEVVCNLKCIPVSNESLLRENKVFLSPKTLRKYHHLGINPRIFLKIGGRLFIDLDEWTKIIAEAKSNRDKKVELLNRLADVLAKDEVQK
ncbi:MAG TPA: hypothetical protein PKK26_16175 [Candidatus Wallbacteria bacterium]|nr:hypothetical protein [Candidatus Wallbacteria bacterium]